MAAMHVEVDQSGRIEFTKDDTVLAFSNGESFSVLITAATKRLCITKLRNKRLAGSNLHIQLFAVALFLLLREHIGRLSLVTIDIEYLGHEASVKEHLLNLLRRDGCLVSADQIDFQPIGKHSRAHHSAIGVFRGKTKPARVIAEADLLREFR